MTEVIQPELFVCSEAENSFHLKVCLNELIARIPLILDVLAPWRPPESAMQKAEAKRYQLRTSFGVSAKASVPGALDISIVTKLETVCNTRHTLVDECT
jgi:hypothetical protein